MGIAIKQRSDTMPTRYDLISQIKPSYYQYLPLVDIKTTKGEEDPSDQTVEYNYEQDQSTTPENYTVRQYYVDGEKTPRYTVQEGQGNGVDVQILQGRYPNRQDIVFNDTLYNGVNQLDPRYLQYKQQFEAKRQGGYLRLQKQGGKLTEVWTPFN